MPLPVGVPLEVEPEVPDPVELAPAVLLLMVLPPVLLPPVEPVSELPAPVEAAAVVLLPAEVPLAEVTVELPGEVELVVGSAPWPDRPPPPPRKPPPRLALRWCMCIVTA